MKYLEEEDETPEFWNKIATEAFSEAAVKAMETMGYVVIALDGWVVKKFKDGTIEKIVKIGEDI